MSFQIESIIRKHWKKRHDPDPRVRQMAISMILTHINLLRIMRNVDNNLNRKKAA